MIRKASRILLLLLACASFAFADNTPIFTRLGATNLDPNIPTIQSVLGYDFGERITRHGDMVRYLEALAKASPRMVLETTGETYEGRKLYNAIVSSAENISKLESLRQANVRLADAMQTSSAEANEIIKTNPVFVCLSDSIHGDEHSGVEAGLALIYYLIASNDIEIVEMLKQTVIIFDPMENPDGRERFIQYFYSSMGPAPNQDPNAAEHNQSWPGGRFNHYLFDMNRDWIVLSQNETRARIKAYQKYFPQIFIDVHEMGSDSSYFFPPPSIPHNPNLPDSVKDWWNRLGKAVSSEFDRQGIEYYTQERYDFWYPGYGDGWPTYNGSLSATFEQGSVRGLIRKRYDGTIVHYRDAIWHHFVSTLVTCKMAASEREAKLLDFYQFRASAVEEGRTGPVRAYLIKRSFDPSLADRLIEKLIWQGIRVEQLSSELKVTATGYDNPKPESITFQAGDYMISMAQPLKRLIQAMFEKETLPDEKFLKAEEQRRKDREPTEFYDISAWSLPLAYGMEVYSVGETLHAAATPVIEIKPESPAVPSATYAYLLNYNSNQGIEAAAGLLKRNVRTYFSTKPFTANGKHYNAGSLIVKIKDNIGELQRALQEIAKETGAQFDAASSGVTEEGPDLSSDDVVFLEKPRIAILMQPPTDPTSAGAIRYLLEQRYGFEVTALPISLVASADLKDYNVFFMPDSLSRWGTYEQHLGTNGQKALKSWVENGGTLIAIQGGASFLIEKKEMTSVRNIQNFMKDSTEPAPEKKDDEESEEKDTEPADLIPGTIVRAKLNLKNFITYGYGKEEIPVFVNSSNVFESGSDEKAAVTYVDAGRLKISGLIWEIASKRLEKKAYATEESLKKGHVILFAEDPGFRAYWEGLNRLLFNGMIYGPSL